MSYATEYQTVKTGTAYSLLIGNQVLIHQPVPASRTVTSIAVQSRPMYQTEPSPVGEKADNIKEEQR